MGDIFAPAGIEALRDPRGVIEIVRAYREPDYACRHLTGLVCQRVTSKSSRKLTSEDGGWVSSLGKPSAMTDQGRLAGGQPTITPKPAGWSGSRGPTSCK